MRKGTFPLNFHVKISFSLPFATNERNKAVRKFSFFFSSLLHLRCSALCLQLKLFFTLWMETKWNVFVWLSFGSTQRRKKKIHQICYQWRLCIDIFFFVGSGSSLSLLARFRGRFNVLFSFTPPDDPGARWWEGLDKVYFSTSEAFIAVCRETPRYLRNTTRILDKDK